ncbi:MAG: hypothetical protein M0Q02_08830 [Candidatus Muirbacterium halophilum]|nr:hypothetical protein [Candidatus Muirbacterium halophilum]MCK9472004.1 hypothetical protein [Bacilli bacterium]
MKKFNSVELTYNSEPFLVRHAKVEDCPLIMDLYNRLYRGFYTIEFCTNAQKYIEAMEDPTILWLVLEHNKKVVASVFWKINAECRIAKIMGAAVRPEFRGLSIMKDIAKIGCDYCFYTKNFIDLIYSTTRTNAPAPQKILKSIGFDCIGILPNVVKVKSFETHSIMVKYHNSVMERRQREYNLLSEVFPIYKLVKETFNFDENPKSLELPEKKRLKLRDIPFEAIYHPSKARELFEKRIKERNFTERFFLQSPNLVLYNEDLDIEVFIRWIDDEKQANIIWLNYENKNWYNILNSITDFCYNLNIRYFEILIDAWDSKKQKAAIEAKFVPSAYFPALFFNENNKVRRDAVVFVRSFEILDFSEIYASGDSAEYIKEFYRSWERIYIGNFFKNLG